MRLNKLPPLEFVTRTKYWNEREDKLERPEIIIGASYTARLIQNPLCENDYAGDYCVVADELYVPRKRRLAELFAPALGRLTLLPLSPDDGSKPIGNTEPFLIRADGTLISESQRILTRVEHEKGYLLDNTDELDKEWAAFMLRTASLDLTTS